MATTNETFTSTRTSTTVSKTVSRETTPAAIMDDEPDPAVASFALVYVMIICSIMIMVLFVLGICMYMLKQKSLWPFDRRKKYPPPSDIEKSARSGKPVGRIIETKLVAVGDESTVHVKRRSRQLDRTKSTDSQEDLQKSADSGSHKEIYEQTSQLTIQKVSPQRSKKSKRVVFQDEHGVLANLKDGMDKKSQKHIAQRSKKSRRVVVDQGEQAVLANLKTFADSAHQPPKAYKDRSMMVNLKTGPLKCICGKCTRNPNGSYDHLRCQ